VGFDVVPTDTLAFRLARKLPDAVKLELAFYTSGRPSRGTLRTMISEASSQSTVRQAGRLVGVPATDCRREVETQGRRYSGLSIPWGDVSTAFYSTGIPNITVYLLRRQGRNRSFDATRLAMSLLRFPLVKGVLDKAVASFMQGPSDEERARGRCEIWG